VPGTLLAQGLDHHMTTPAAPPTLGPSLGPSPLASGQELPVADALAAISSQITVVAGVETVALHQASGRVLAADVVSPINVPAHDNSAMDGYALHGSDLQADAPTVLQARAGTLFAGATFAGDLLASGECVRIMTGAVMPPGLDTVVPLELCQPSADSRTIHIKAGVLRAGENRRLAGEDLRQGTAALPAGRVLRPADVGLVASLGLAQVQVRRRLRVALFSTGDELCTPGQPLPTGAIYDSNRYSLHAALQQMGVDVLDLGLVADTPAALHAAVAQATASCDAVVTSGGVSMGDADHTRSVLASAGTVGFWKVAMRPGRPFAFGQLHGTGAQSGQPVALFALPGNPVAALVTLYVLAQPALLQMAGALTQARPVLQARCAVAIRKRPGRTEYQRGVLAQTPAGDWQVRLTGAQGAGVLSSMSQANALVVLRHDQGSVAVGDWVDVWPFEGLV
jgi:molybdopterin molybdotransferase